MNMLSVTPIYIALLGLMFLPFTLRVGYYREKHKIYLGDGGDKTLLRLIRGQGNFIETVPIAIVMLVLMEMLGAGPIWLHTLGALLVVGRLLHYLGMTRSGPSLYRAIGMFMTLAVYLGASVWMLVNLWQVYM